MNYTKDELIAEIERRAPWYQSIDFPMHGVSATDNVANALIDAAWDNKTDFISLEEAARLRPKPKYQLFKEFIPKAEGLDVLEIGCNCGFFSFEFANMGARTVTGIDVSPKWLDNASWAKKVLGHENVRFYNCDFMRFDAGDKPAQGLFSKRDKQVPLPDALYDMVFMSTVLDHMFFPLFSIYKMCRISRKWVIIDIPCADTAAAGEAIARLSVPPDKSHHGFSFSIGFLRTFINRLGIAFDDIAVHEYKEGRSAIFVIDVSRMADGLIGA